MRLLTVVSLFIVGAGALGAASAGDIYCNNQGRDCSDRPSPGATFVRVANPSATRSEAATAPGNASAPPAIDAAKARLGQEASRAAVQKDVAASRAEQCKQAKDAYQKSVEARRVYRVNKAGEREYLSDTDAEQVRLNARLDMERSCGSPGS
jgi:hypothetical protein